VEMDCGRTPLRAGLGVVAKPDADVDGADGPAILPGDG